MPGIKMLFTRNITLPCQTVNSYKHLNTNRYFCLLAVVCISIEANHLFDDAAIGKCASIILKGRYK